MDYRHTKFGLIWIKESKVKEGGNPPNQVENVLNRPCETGLKNQKKCLLGFNHPNSVVKTNKKNGMLILAICCSRILVISKFYSMFTFYIENHEPFVSLTKNCL